MNINQTAELSMIQIIKDQRKIFNMLSKEDQNDVICSPFNGLYLAISDDDLDKMEKKIINTKE